MPADVFAALAALVRAEARRNAPRPEPCPPAGTEPTDPCTSPDESTPRDRSASVPAQPAPPPVGPDDPAVVPAAPDPAGGRPHRGLLRRLRALIASVVLCRRLRAAGRRPAPENS
ncbi:hypothetical protein K2224_18860 [Streptomyces sp. BHT-5-2]|uniref:hypothetical protein n=1 Tax=unclassified Streptomyces TaxID=2593676 RepID=UPI001C8ED996|nr:hypothetical protein [Streptomyces sp. BHT-5-2]QZL04953.1 hypothetical protein K2224_18860 [Streptomyces sp. BHT-5-2]